MLPTRPASGPSGPTDPSAHGRVAEVVLSGELDASNSACIAAQLDRLCQQGFQYLRIDLGSVTFLDATIVSVLIEARAGARAVGSDLVLTGVHGLPLRMLQLVHLDEDLIERDDAGE